MVLIFIRKEVFPIKVFCDFDNTIVRSNKQIIKMINRKYGTNKTEDNLMDYFFKSICDRVTKKEIEEMFESEEFFSEVEFHSNSLEILKMVDDLVICSAGTQKNLSKKRDFVKEHFCCEFIGVNHGVEKLNLDMSNSIYIDDLSEVLTESNASKKILFRDCKDQLWTRPVPNSFVYTADSWNDIGDMLHFWGVI